MSNEPSYNFDRIKQSPVTLGYQRASPITQQARKSEAKSRVLAGLMSLFFSAVALSFTFVGGAMVLEEMIGHRAFINEDRLIRGIAVVIFSLPIFYITYRWLREAFFPLKKNYSHLDGSFSSGQFDSTSDWS